MVIQRNRERREEGEEKNPSKIKTMETGIKREVGYNVLKTRERQKRREKCEREKGQRNEKNR